MLTSADTDLGELLALGCHTGLSIVIFRGAPHRPDQQTRLLLGYLGDVEDSLRTGAVVIAGPDRVRVRLLPITE